MSHSKVKKKTPLNCRIFLLLCLLIFIAYSNSFQASWQLDDKPNILTNYRVQPDHLSFQNFMAAAFARPGSADFYRPVACISLAFNWYFGQQNVFGYHVVNFVVHCCAASLLFLNIITLFSTPRLAGRYSSDQINFIGILAVLFWALNPINVQAVTYIVQRMASMAAMFSLLFLLFYLKARLNQRSLYRIVYLICSIFCYILALLSKENTITIILAIPIFEFLFFEHIWSKKAIWNIFVGSIIVCLICLLAGYVLQPKLFDFILNYYENRPFTLTERVLTQPRIVLHYLTQLFFPAPWRLSIEHDVILSTSLFSPWTTGPVIIFHFLIVLLAIKISKKQPLFSLAILFYYLNHLIESTIVPLELVFEHRNYLPSLFLFLPVAQVFNWILARWQDNKIIRLAIHGLLSFLFIVEGYATYERNKAWKTEESLWLDALLKAPNSSRPLATLAIKLAWGPDPSVEKYRNALKLTERTLSMRMGRRRLDAAQFGNMASIYNKLGEYENANIYYNKALGIAPKDAGIRYNYSKNLIMMGNFYSARSEITAIIDMGFIHADYFSMLGFIDLWTGQPEKALSYLQQAMKYAPGRPDILLSLGKCLSSLGYYDRANWFFLLSRKSGRDDAVVSLCIIENALKSNRYELSHRELKSSLKKFSLSGFFRPINAPNYERYRELPLNNQLLIPYLRSELYDIMTESFP